MNKRIKAKLNKRFLIDSILDPRFGENGYHWVVTEFDHALRWRERWFGVNDRALVDSRVNYAVHLAAMFDAPHSALRILQSVFQDNPKNIEVPAELIECCLELNLLDDAAAIFERCKVAGLGDESILEYADYFTGIKEWSSRCSSELSKNVIRPLMDGEFDLCWGLLAGKEGLEVELLKLAVYGAQDCHGSFIEQLKNITENFSDICRDFKFWFFRTRESDSDPEYWKLCSHPSFSKFGVVLQ